VGGDIGATKVDEGCTIRLLSRQLFAAGASTNGNGYASDAVKADIMAPPTSAASGYAGGSVAGFGMRTH
jgi:hypothetical protein